MSALSLFPLEERKRLVKFSFSCHDNENNNTIWYIHTLDQNLTNFYAILPLSILFKILSVKLI